VLDPAYAPGTGTPEPGGLTARELLRAVRKVALAVDLAGVDVVEVAPPFDGPGAITAEVAHRVVMEVLSVAAVKKLGVPGGSSAAMLDFAGPAPA
jgi:agmatinase